MHNALLPQCHISIYDNIPVNGGLFDGGGGGGTVERFTNASNSSGPSVHNDGNGLLVDVFSEDLRGLSLAALLVSETIMHAYA